jgi:multisubunit Na+/H+ antiporter MnhG subunit
MPKNKNRKDVAKHILPTSANLLGLCFILLSYIKLAKLSAETLIDENLGVVIVLFLFSSIFSYASMRANRHSDIYEKRSPTLSFLSASAF